MSWLRRLTGLIRRKAAAAAAEDSVPSSRSPESGIRRKMAGTEVVIREITVPPGDKRFAEQRALEALYTKQRPVLEERFKQAGVDVFVADYALARAQDSSFSYCVWNEGDATLLPETEFVILTGVGSKTVDYWETIVPWKVLLELTGDRCLAREPDLIPVRWRTLAWPDREMLQSLRARAARF